MYLQTAIALLPTPSASRYGNNRGGAAGRVGEIRHSLDAIEHLLDREGTWGKYAAAIERWERITGRPVPEPTMIGTRGARVLNPFLVEWMMGLRQGHVTNPYYGLSRNAMLKALGNGVVPQQGKHAISGLWGRR